MDQFTTMNQNQQLAWHDLQWCLRRAPKILLSAMKKNGPELYVAGGYVRACVTGEDINDIDCFCPTKDKAHALAVYLAEGDEKRIWTSDNAYTVKGYETPIQVIHRWTFTSPSDAIDSFDFTIARAAFWWSESWQSVCDPKFYPDLAGKRLIYCAPKRNEDAGGSLLRVLKFYQRGYRIPLDSMGAVLSRMMQGVRWEDVNDHAIGEELKLAEVLTGLLREVDPNLDPKHIAHLPSESARDGQKLENEGAEGQ